MLKVLDYDDHDWFGCLGGVYDQEWNFLYTLFVLFFYGVFL
jgi:hypothetical protein